MGAADPADLPPDPLCNPEVIRRLLVALVAEEIGRLRARPVPPGTWAGWTDATTIDEDGMGVDSLARLDLVARLNAFFHLHESGVEDYLLVRPRLGDWVELVAESRRRAGTHLSFRSSGSTGAPRDHLHRLADLRAEAAAHAAFLAGLAPGLPRRVIALVPPHHVYGFLFTVLLPALAGAEPVEARHLAPPLAAARAQPGDLLVATPFLWDLVLRGGVRLAPGIAGTSSGAPAPASLWPGLAARGFDPLVEIYGSTETAGLGRRLTGSAPFTLLPGRARGPRGAILGPPGTDGTRARLPVPDRLVWDGAETFRVAGRRDGAVQVGGVNVRPARVRAILCAHPGVAEAAVRLDPATGRLKAFLVPAEGWSAARLRPAIQAHAAAGLSAPERPLGLAFGPALPVSPTGKPADWPADPAASLALSGA